MLVSLSLLGGFQFSANGETVSLAFSAARAPLLWPEHGQTAAYTNVRQTLARTRKAFPPHTSLGGALTITPHTIQ